MKKKWRSVHAKAWAQENNMVRWGRKRRRVSRRDLSVGTGRSLGGAKPQLANHTRTTV